MAIVEVKCPQLSESVAEATVLQWKKRPGERVEIDEILVEIETDKVVLEVPAPVAGVIYRCNVCRLELMVDAKTEKLALAPLPDKTERPKPT